MFAAAIWEGWQYLAIILDVLARRIVGYAISDRLSARLVTMALTHALTQRDASNDLTLHSDRGIQYASDVVREMLSAQNIHQSMSGNGNCYDNAITETFFHAFRTELIYWERFATREEARMKISEHIEAWYNRQRFHSSLGYKTSVEFEPEHHAITN